MNVGACYILHYGKEWLAWSMKSVRPYVNDIFCFYSHVPSHGHSTDLKNPDSRDELYEIAKQYQAWWFDSTTFGLCFANEGEHRTFAVETCRKNGIDTVLVVDADEIWDPNHLVRFLKQSELTDARNLRVNMAHFWRSTKWVCYDGAYPTRIVKPNVMNSADAYYSGDERVFHFGYAQKPETIFYKQSIHGHKGEWRPNWYEEKFIGWRPETDTGDVHPTNENYWYPMLYMDYGQLERLIGDHPYWGKDIIV